MKKAIGILIKFLAAAFVAVSFCTLCYGDQPNGELKMRIVISDDVSALIEYTPESPLPYVDVVFKARLGARTEITLSDSDGDSGNGYQFYYEKIYSQCMTEKIHGSLFGIDGEGRENLILSISKKDGISVASYCRKLYETYPENEKLVSLISNLLEFGAESQKYANYNTNDLADSESWVSAGGKDFELFETDNQFLKIADFAIITTADDFFTEGGAREPVPQITSASLQIENKIAIRFTVEAGSAEGITVKLMSRNGDYEKTVSVSGTCEILTPFLFPTEYEDVYTISLYQNENLLEKVSYSVNTYCSRMRNNAEAANLAKAIYNLGRAADAYVNKYDYEGVTYEGKLEAANFALRNNEVGYEANAAKKAFVRSLTCLDPSLVGRESRFTLFDEKGETASKGRLVYAGLSYGVQMWEARFDDLTEPGEYTLKVEIKDSAGADIYTQTSGTITIGEEVLTNTLLKGLTIYNGQAREVGDANGGFYDCNSAMTDLYSIGCYLNGLVKTYEYQKDKISEEDKNELIRLAGVAFDYLLSEYDSSTGQFHNTTDGRVHSIADDAMQHQIYALYGFSAYLSVMKDVDPVRCSAANYNKAVKSLSYMTTTYNIRSSRSSYTNLGYAYWENLIPVYYYLFDYSGLYSYKSTASNLIDEMVTYFDISALVRSGQRAISSFEGIYLFAKRFPNEQRTKNWIAKLKGIGTQYYEAIENNAFSIIPVSSYKNAQSEWDNMWKTPKGEDFGIGADFGIPGEFGWLLNTSKAAQAMDACFLAELTGDSKLEELATGEISYVMGLNPGAESGDHGGATLFVGNFGNENDTAWKTWGFTMKNDKWYSVVNGFRIIDGKYTYNDAAGGKNWYYSETFLFHDGAFAYAINVYDSYINNNN